MPPRKKRGAKIAVTSRKTRSVARALAQIISDPDEIELSDLQDQVNTAKSNEESQQDEVVESKTAQYKKLGKFRGLQEVEVQGTSSTNNDTIDESVMEVDEKPVLENDMDYTNTERVDQENDEFTEKFTNLEVSVPEEDALIVTDMDEIVVVDINADYAENLIITTDDVTISEDSQSSVIPLDELHTVNIDPDHLHSQDTVIYYEDKNQSIQEEMATIKNTPPKVVELILQDFEDSISGDGSASHYLNIKEKQITQDNLVSDDSPAIVEDLENNSKNSAETKAVIIIDEKRKEELSAEDRLLQDDSDVELSENVDNLDELAIKEAEDKLLNVEDDISIIEDKSLIKEDNAKIITDKIEDTNIKETLIKHSEDTNTDADANRDFTDKDGKDPFKKFEETNSEINELDKNNQIEDDVEDSNDISDHNLLIKDCKVDDNIEVLNTDKETEEIIFKAEALSINTDASPIVKDVKMETDSISDEVLSAEISERKIETDIEESVDASMISDDDINKCEPKIVDAIDDTALISDDEQDIKVDKKKSLAPSRKSKRISLKVPRKIVKKPTISKSASNSIETSDTEIPEINDDALVTKKTKKATKKELKKAEKEKIKAEKAIAGDDSEVTALEKATAKRTKKALKKEEKKALKIPKAEKKSKKLPLLKTKNKHHKKNKIIDEIDEADENSIRRSSRIKTISSSKKVSKGKGLVRKDSMKSLDADYSDNSNSGFGDNDKTNETASVASSNNSDAEHKPKPVKVKSRWRRSSELEMNTTPNEPNKSSSTPASPAINDKNKIDPEVEKRLKQFVHLRDNQYLTERISCKEAKKMTCDCFMTPEEINRGELGCGEDCLNRLLMIECGSLCTVGHRCTNKRFQKGQSASCEAFNTGKKGIGIRATANIPYGEFIMEYVGEVLDPDEFDDRAAEYSKDNNAHYYFMSLRTDAVIDATQKGNISRFINHSCDPNAETQKWTVNGELRIGFFSKRTILAGEEITFDYQFQRYGKEAQKCYCEAHNCRGWLGEEPDEEDEEEDEEEEEDDEEEEEEDGEDEEEELLANAKIGDSEETEDKIREEKDEDGVAVKVATVKKVIKKIKVPKPKKEKPPKKEKIKLIRPRKIRKDIFEDLDLDEEIASLQTTGLKNQAHTLKLSRLIVRAKEPAQRTKLLKLLKRGELPCRRLFLDYHGLRLIHGWMTDAQHMAKQDSKMEALRLEILQTIATLPIPNKTMLQDSKVLATVEKWSISEKPAESPEDSESNSPNDDNEAVVATPVIEEIKEEPIKEEEVIEIPEIAVLSINEDEEIRFSVGMTMMNKPNYRTKINIKNLIQELINSFDDDYDIGEDMDISPKAFDDKDLNSEIKEVTPVVIPPKKEAIYDIVTEIIALAIKLLKEWSSLKEVFRIPKKERIEQMKEHEREADKRYKDYNLERDNRSNDRKRDNRYRSTIASTQSIQYRPRVPELNDWTRRKEGTRVDERNPYSIHYPRISKHERRKLFAMEVEAKEEERRRKQQELWRQHEKHCRMMGTDPRFTAPYDPNRGYQCIWNPQVGQWQNYALPEQSMFNPKVQKFPYLPHPLTATQQPPPKLQSHLQQMPPQQMKPHPQISHPQILPHQQMQSHPQMQPHAQMLQHMPAGMVPSNIPPPNMTTASMGTMPPMPNIPAMPAVPYIVEEEDPSKVKFMGPIPPPAKLPPKWKCAKDKYGRPYYYHIKIRKTQWEPPELPMEVIIAEDYNSETSSSSDTSSLSSDSSSDDSDSDDIDDTRLMLDIRDKFVKMDAQKKLEKERKELREKNPQLPETPHASVDVPQKTLLDIEDSILQDISILADNSMLAEISMLQDSIILDHTDEATSSEQLQLAVSSLDKRLIDELGFIKKDEPPTKKRRVGLVQEHIISPRTDEDRLQFKEDVKKYKQNKEKLKKQKEIILQQTKKHLQKTGTPQKSTSKSTSKPSEASTSSELTINKSSSTSKSTKLSKRKLSVKTKLKEMDANSEAGKKIKEGFRSSMASVMVSILNIYRKSDCKQGRITNTEDFKHLARKLTHFVMLKELKHCQNIEDLTCTESVKAKAKEFVRKYMSKFGEIYQKPTDDIEY